MIKIKKTWVFCFSAMRIHSSQKKLKIGSFTTFYLVLEVLCSSVDDLYHMSVMWWQWCSMFFCFTYTLFVVTGNMSTWFVLLWHGCFYPPLISVTVSAFGTLEMLSVLRNFWDGFKTQVWRYICECLACGIMSCVLLPQFEIYFRWWIEVTAATRSQSFAYQCIQRWLLCCSYWCSASLWLLVSYITNTSLD